MFTRSVIAAAFAVLMLSGIAHAQHFPERQITLIVSFAPGGLSDIPARILAPELQRRLGQPVIVQNVAGASGSAGGSYVVRAAPDGYTLLVSAVSEVQNFYYLKLPYDALKDLAPVGEIADEVPLVLVVKADSPFKTVGDLIAFAKTNPGIVNFSTSGAATAPAIAVSQLNALSGTKIGEIGYKGTGPAAAAVLSKDVQASFVFYPSAAELIKAGKLRALAVTGIRRTKNLPQVPTMLELGFAGFRHMAFVGLSAPKGTPRHVIARLNEALNESLQSPAVRRRLEQLGMSIPDAPNAPDAYGKWMEEEAARQADLAKLSHHALR